MNLWKMVIFKDKIIYQRKYLKLRNKIKVYLTN